MASWLITAFAAVQLSALIIFLFEWLSPSGYNMKVCKHSRGRPNQLHYLIVSVCSSARSQILFIPHLLAGVGTAVPSTGANGLSQSFYCEVRLIENIRFRYTADVDSFGSDIQQMLIALVQIYSRC